MSLQKKNLIKLPVETKSGQALGRVEDFDLNPLNHQIERYYVRRSRQLTAPFPKTLIVHYTQVVSITNVKMIVDDNLSAQTRALKERIQREQIVPAAGS